MLRFGTSTSYWPHGSLSQLLFFIYGLSSPTRAHLSSFSTLDDYDDDYH